jgi:8-oxo-dGTP pyrophosphatase MutT (NUDIX family)
MAKAGPAIAYSAKPWRRARIVNRLFHLYWRFARGMTLGVRGMVLDGAGRVFLIRHGYADGWHMPGGGVEVGETFLGALERELAEEGNIEMTAPPLLHGIYFYPLYSQRDHVAIYVVRSFRQTATPVPNREIAEHGFFPVDALPQATTAGTRARIAEVLHGAAVPQRW